MVFIVGGVSAYVAMIDWNEHKDKIAEQISDVSGKLVVFEGPVSFKIFPSPDLIASNIKVFSNEAGHQDTPLATIDKLVAKLDLWALLKGNFEVKMMSLINPKIFMEVDNDGRLNWQSSITEEQKLSLDNIEIRLDSVLLEKATLNFVNTKHDIDITLENLNAEVIAPSIFGPYRIEGSYVKDNNPEGFALSLGRFSESFATSVNFVLNHPTSETFVRFDGSVLLKNDAINGDVIIESKNPVDFLNKNFKDLQLGPEYNYPFALSLQADTNKTKIALSNIVVKYGATAGAGNILVPLDPDYAVEEDAPKRRRAEIGFEMTDLDLAPAEAALKSLLAKYGAENAVYDPQLKFDFIADLKSVNTLFNGQTLKDFNLSVDYLNNELKIRNLSVSLPGDTQFSVSGEVFSDEDVFTYSLEPEYTTNDLQKLLAWLGYEINPITQATYKRSAGDATVEGTLKTIKIAPFNLTIDKSVFSGSLGIIAGERMNAFLDVQADSVNFDNYIPSLPEEEQKKSLADKINYRFSKLGFLNDFDFRLMGNLGLGIYEGVPFENSQFDMDVAQGVLTISKLNIGNVANASLEATATVKGLGKSLLFENLKYNLEVKDFSAFLNKFSLPLPDINLKKLKNFSSKGIVSGSPSLMAMKAISKLEYLDIVFGGQLGKQNDAWVLNGNLDVRASDFVQMVNDLNFNYKPKTFSLGLFALSANIVGTSDNFALSEMNAFVGSNNFKGNVSVDSRSGRPDITTSLDINKFELERFVYNDVPQNANVVPAFRNNDDEKAEFIARPNLDKSRINQKIIIVEKTDVDNKFVSWLEEQMPNFVEGISYNELKNKQSNQPSSSNPFENINPFTGEASKVQTAPPTNDIFASAPSPQSQIPEEQNIPKEQNIPEQANDIFSQPKPDTNQPAPATPTNTNEQNDIFEPKPIQNSHLETTQVLQTAPEQQNQTTSPTTPTTNTTPNVESEESQVNELDKKSGGFANLLILLVILVVVTVVSIELGKFLYNTFGA